MLTKGAALGVVSSPLRGLGRVGVRVADLASGWGSGQFYQSLIYQ